MARFTQDRMYEMLSEIKRKSKPKYRVGGKITEADCPFGYSLVNGKCVPDPDCEDEQCRETDEIQAIYDYASTIPQQVVNFERSMVNHIQDDLGGNAKLGWKEEGIKSFVEPSCMYVAGLGYRCAPATETYFKKFNPVHFNSNQGFIHAVDRGDVPFTRVGKFSDRNFDAQEKGNVQIGDIVNFKGADNSHAMTFAGYTEDGHPKYIDSNGDPADYGLGMVWRNLRPNTVGLGPDYAYVNRFNKDRFIKDTYSKEIEELEKQARENPTYYKYGGLAKFVEGGSIQPMIDENGEARCPDGYTYNPETGWCEGYGDKCPDGYVKDPITGKCKSIAYRAIPGVLDENKKAIDRSKLEKQYTEWPEDLNLTTTKFDNLYKDPYIEQAGYYKVYSDKNDYLTLIPFYPDLNYKVEVDPNKPEGFDKSTNTYYVKSKDTHQYEKYRQWQILKQEEKENLDKIQKAGLKTSIAETTLYDAEDPDYKITSISGGIDNLDKSDYFYEENKRQAEAFKKLYEDPEYIPEAIRNQSYDDYQKKRKQGNISAEKCPECALYHGSTYDISDDYVRENMNLSSVTKEYPDVIYKKDEDGYEEPQNLDWEKQYTYTDPSLDKAIPTYEPPELELEGFGIPRYDFTEGKYYPKKKNTYKLFLNQRYDTQPLIRKSSKFVTKKEDPLIRFITGYDREYGTPKLYKSRKNWNERYIDASSKINQDLENAENVKFPSFRGVPIASWDDYRARREYKKEWKNYVRNELPEILERNRQAKEAYQIEMQKIRAQEEADALKRQNKKYGGLMKFVNGGTNDCPDGYIKDENGNCVPANYDPNVANENTEFLKSMANSPLFVERYARMIGKPLEEVTQEAEDYRKQILQNLETVQMGDSAYPPKPFGKDVGGYYFHNTMLDEYSQKLNEVQRLMDNIPNKGKYNKELKARYQSIYDDAKKEYDDKLKTTHKIYFKKWNKPYDLHERSHASVEGELQVANPYKFKDLSEMPHIQKLIFETMYPADDQEYYESDDEIKSAKDVAAETMMRLGLYDPINENFTPEHYKKLMELKRNNSLDPETEGQIDRITTPFTEEETIRMFNDIVQNTSQESSMRFGRYGGLLKFIRTR